MTAIAKHRALCALIAVALIACAFVLAAPLSAHADIPLQIQAAGAPSVTPPSDNPGWIAKNIWYPIVAGASSVLISISAWLLGVASNLFNWLVEHTIIQFGAPGELYETVKTGVNAAWAAIRDVANILIIGMFTFIAISIILGNKEYGQKRLIANVLIIAVLINFSLLFTKLVIDASNYAASQFYGGIAPVAAQQASGGAAGITFSTYSQVGIAGAFVNYMGVTSVGDTYEAMKTLAQRSSGWVAFAHGVLAAVVLGGAAAVLFYGSFLLVSRAVLFIFLMIVSAGAFATYLIPKLSESGSYGWHAWWKSLLQSAALAPLLMIFLWVTLKVAAEIKTQLPTGGTLGNLLSSTSTAADIGALFTYLIILGLLYASFRLASSFSEKIGGFGLTGTVLGSAAFAPVALGSLGAAAALRFTRGGAAMQKSAALEKDIHARSLDLAQMPRKTGADKAAYSKAFDELAGQIKKKERADARAKSSYNLMNTAPAKTAAGVLGVPSFLSGAEAKPHGYADTAKARAQEATKRAETVAVSEAKVREEVYAKRKEADAIERARLRDEREAAKTLLDTTRTARETQLAPKEQKHQEAVAEVRTANAERAQVEADYGAKIRGLGEQLSKIPAGQQSDAQRQAVRNEIESVETQHKGALSEQDAKIRQAQSNADTMQAEVQTLGKSTAESVARAEEAYRKAGEAMKDFEERVKKEVKEETEKIAASSAKVGEDIATRFAHRRLSNLPLRILGAVGDTFGLPIYRIENDAMAMKTRETYKKSIKGKGLKERLAAWKELGEEEGGGAKESKKEEPPAAHH